MYLRNLSVIVRGEKKKIAANKLLIAEVHIARVVLPVVRPAYLLFVFGVFADVNTLGRHSVEAQQRTSCFFGAHTFIYAYTYTYTIYNT